MKNTIFFITVIFFICSFQEIIKAYDSDLSDPFGVIFTPRERRLNSRDVDDIEFGLRYQQKSDGRELDRAGSLVRQPREESKPARVMPAEAERSDSVVSRSGQNQVESKSDAVGRAQESFVEEEYIPPVEDEDQSLSFFGAEAGIHMNMSGFYDAMVVDEIAESISGGLGFELMGIYEREFLMPMLSLKVGAGFRMMRFVLNNAELDLGDGIETVEAYGTSTYSFLAGAHLRYPMFFAMSGAFVVGAGLQMAYNLSTEGFEYDDPDDATATKIASPPSFNLGLSLSLDYDRNFIFVGPRFFVDVTFQNMLVLFNVGFRI
jgi:hypothetical protein